MRSSLIWVCTVCSDLSVPIFKIITVYKFNKFDWYIIPDKILKQLFETGDDNTGSLIANAFLVYLGILKVSTKAILEVILAYLYESLVFGVGFFWTHKTITIKNERVWFLQCSNVSIKCRWNGKCQTV